MFKKVFWLTFGIIFLFSIIGWAEETVKLNDNRIIKLFDDGTYEFIEQDEGITFILKSLKDGKSYDETPICECKFDVTNNSYGTIYWISLYTNVYDDRGDKIEGYASMGVIDIDPFEGSFGGEKKISKGGTVTAVMKLKGRCEFLEKIEAIKVKNKYCNMRNLPEGIDCLDLVNLKSDVKRISFVKNK